jgi:hypothetical protein
MMGGAGMLAQQFDAYGGVVPYLRKDNTRVESGSGARRRARVGAGLFCLVVVLIVLARIVCFSTAQTSGFANVENALQADVK